MANFLHLNANDKQEAIGSFIIGTGFKKFLLIKTEHNAMVTATFIVITVVLSSSIPL